MEIKTIYMCFFLSLLCLNCQGCREEERSALLQIKSSINSPEGTAFSNWYEEDCCQWEGVTCNASTGCVSTIYIMQKRDPSLYGKWYPNASSFAEFKELQELVLPGNHIGGFTSPYELNKLKQLQKLDLRDNSMEDGSHLCWGNLHSLYSLDLSHNSLQGNIPACFGNMTSLEYLDLSNNKFGGSYLSALIHNLTSIKSLILSRNEFKGRISLSIFANLSRLRNLDISYNTNLTIEPESPSWFPSFSLISLKLGGCNLKRIPSFLSKQHHLRSLDLSYNQLEGSIPSWLLHNVTSELWIRGNNLSGPFPETFHNRSSQVTVLDISYNFLHGKLPKDVGQIFLQLHYLNVSFNYFTGNLPQSFSRMNQLQTLDLSDNEFIGEIPHGMTSRMNQLRTLDLSNNEFIGEIPHGMTSRMNQLRTLDLSNNEFIGEIPHGMTSNLTSLEYLSLSRNKLRGDALPTNSSLPNLRFLYLRDNDFSGTFPDSLSKSMDLQILDIGNNGLSGELSSYLSAFPRLRVLLLGGNRFEGSMPAQLCQMGHLHILDLSRNNLSGGIPTCVDNITSLTEGSYHATTEYDSRNAILFTTKGSEYRYRGRILSYMSGIDVSSNKLTGSIPVQVTQLISLCALNLSSNLLTGQIPKSFANITNLESLDLSHNKLFGELSQEITALVFLEVFNVSYNNLSGSPPLEGQFAIFDEGSYLGNPLLCGQPLTSKCHERVEKSSYNFSSNMATAYNMLFWCIVYLLC